MGDISLPEEVNEIPVFPLDVTVGAARSRVTGPC